MRHWGWFACLVVLFVFVVSAQGHLKLLPAGNTIGFQAHSYNDLNEWVQLLKKGARYIKIDPQYQPNSFCANQQRVNRSDERGCFVLNHDPVSSVRKDYNSSLDILDMLRSPLYSPWFKKAERIYIALCFKNAPDPCNKTLTAGKYWLSLVDDFFLEANHRISNLGLNLEFVLDGDGVPRDCFIQRWRPWVATAGPSPAYYSNNVALGYDRWQVLNPDYDDFPTDAKTHFGKFVNSSYSYQIWEPSNQGEILNTSTVYINEGHVHLPGLHFAINIDPAMFEVYSAPNTSKPYTWNVNIEKQGSRPKITAFQDSEGKYSLATIFTLEGHLFYRIDAITPSGLTATHLNGNAFFSNPQPLPSSSLLKNVEAVSSIVMGDTIFLLVTDSMGSSNLYASPKESSKKNHISLSYVGSFSLPSINPAAKIAYSTAAIVSSSCPSKSNSQSLCIVISQVYNDNNTQPFDCGLYAQMWALHFPSFESVKDLTATPIGKRACIQAGVPPQAASIAITSTQTGIEGIVFYSSYGSVYGATLSANLKGHLMVNKKSDKENLFPQPIEIDVGDYPSSSVIQLGNKSPVIFEAHGNGFCQNNEPHNKQPYPAACRQHAIPTDYVLVYNYGSLASWQEYIIRGEKMNACSWDIMHGAYDQGSHPNVALFSYQGQFGVTEVHEGYTANEDWGNCGKPIPRTGLVLDGWPLVQSI